MLRLDHPRLGPKGPARIKEMALQVARGEARCGWISCRAPVTRVVLHRDVRIMIDLSRLEFACAGHLTHDDVLFEMPPGKPKWEVGDRVRWFRSPTQSRATAVGVVTATPREVRLGRRTYFIRLRLGREVPVDLSEMVLPTPRSASKRAPEGG